MLSMGIAFMCLSIIYPTHFKTSCETSDNEDNEIALLKADNSNLQEKLLEKEKEIQRLKLVISNIKGISICVAFFVTKLALLSLLLVHQLESTSIR